MASIPLTRARQLVAGGEDRAVVRHFLDVPTVADAEQEAAGGNLIDQGDQFCRLDRLALGDQADAGAELKPLCHRSRRGEHDERIHDVVIGFRRVAPDGERRRPRHRDMRVLRRPERFRSALFQRQPGSPGPIE